MSALSIIEQAGFKVFLDGDKLGISPANNLTLPQREFLKFHKPEIINELSICQKIKHWLVSIGEVNQEVINETIERCKDDPDTLSYFNQRADGIARPH